MLALSSATEALAGLRRAGSIYVQAYTLHGEILADLKAAARRGARVIVELAGTPHNDPHGKLARENKRVADDLRRAGVGARLCDPVHAKLIVEDDMLYLDGKNWRNGDLVLRTNLVDAASIPMLKHRALAAEAQLLDAARMGDDTIVASESFGGGNPVYWALDRLGRAGFAPRLLVCGNELRGSARERAALSKLVHDGVSVRVTKDSEKFAAVGDGAWIGSANATIDYAAADLPDWGVCSRDGAIAGAVRARAEAEWARSRAFKVQRA
jgi:hypothetical protein